MTIKEVNDLIAAKNPITPEIADKLEKALNISAIFWITREKNYRDKLEDIIMRKKRKK